MLSSLKNDLLEIISHELDFVLSAIFGHGLEIQRQEPTGLA